jgi:hypothetical protein
MPDAPDDRYDETVRQLLACDVSIETIAQLLDDLYLDGGKLRETAEPAQ